MNNKEKEKTTCKTCRYWDNEEGELVGLCENDEADEWKGQSDYCKGYLNKDGTR